METGICLIVLFNKFETHKTTLPPLLSESALFRNTRKSIQNRLVTFAKFKSGIGAGANGQPEAGPENRH